MAHQTAIALLSVCVVLWHATVTGALQLPTARQAVEMANKQMDTSAQNQIVFIEGTKSDSDMRPRQWDIAFYDASRVNGGSMVRVKDGAVVTIGSSLRLCDDAHWGRMGRNFSGYSSLEIINVKRWKHDSDQLLATALSLPKLAGIQVTSVVLSMRKLSDGDVPPVWRVKMRARPQHNPRRERWIGSLRYNGETGELLADELRVEPLLR